MYIFDKKINWLQFVKIICFEKNSIHHFTFSIFIWVWSGHQKILKRIHEYWC